MKFKAIDAGSSEPLADCELEIQILGEESNYIPITTDLRGNFELNDIYEDEKILVIHDGLEVASLIAKDGTQISIKATASEDLE